MKLQLLNKSLNVHLSETKRRSAIKWATFNLCLLAIIIYDLADTTKFYYESTFYYFEIVASCILALSFLTNVFTYIINHSWLSDEVECESEQQRLLLNLNSSNSLLKQQLKTPKPTNGFDYMQNDETINIRNLSWQSAYSEPNSTTAHQTSWMNNNNKAMDSTFAMNKDEASQFQTPPKFKKSDVIMNKSSMNQFLNDVAEQEKSILSAIEAQQNMSGYVSNNLNSFWGNYRFDDFIVSLKTSLYQLSPNINKQNQRDESFTSKDQENNSEVIRTICANKLSNYVANLKMWISKTILEPLVNAVDDVDKAFQQRGFTDMKIGSVGLERIKKIATTNHQLIQHIPMLPKLIPFLELTSNQEFLVQRIRELAKGSCIKNFKFHSGSTIIGSQDESNHTPSDAGIIFHLFCTYLDSQLHPVPELPRAFYSRYVIIGDPKKTSTDYIMKETSKNKSKCAILCSNPITPKFNFVSDQIHTCTYDRNNLFYVIIQFLIHLKPERSLEGVNLEKAGINILNIIMD